MRAQLISHDDEPDRLREQNNSHAMNVEPQVAHALVKSGKLNDVQALARGIFARSIEERLQLVGVQIDPQRRSAQAHALAGSFFLLLD